MAPRKRKKKATVITRKKKRGAASHYRTTPEKTEPRVEEITSPSHGFREGDKSVEKSKSRRLSSHHPCSPERRSARRRTDTGIRSLTIPRVTEFFGLIAQNRIEVLVELLSSGFPVDERRFTHPNPTPLMKACALGHVSIVELFIKHGANVNAQDSRGRMPLHYAASCGHEKIVKVLLDVGCNLDYPSDDEKDDSLPSSEYTSFSKDANEKGRKNKSSRGSIQEDHRSGVPLSDRNKDGMQGLTPLWELTTTPELNLDQIKCYKMLLKAGASLRDYRGKSLIHTIAELDHADLVKELARHPQGVRLLCARLERSGSCCALHRNEEDEGITPLHDAAMRGNLAVFESLACYVEADWADWHTKRLDRSVFHTAALHGCASFLSRFPPTHLSVAQRSSLILLAARSHSASAVRVLLEQAPLAARAALGYTEKETGYTALHYAAYDGSVPVMRLLLDRVCGVDSNLSSSSSSKSDSARSKFKHDKSAGTSRSSSSGSRRKPAHEGRNLNGSTDDGGGMNGAHFSQLRVQDVHGYTALHVAASRCNADVIPLLSACVADVDKEGNTALHAAASARGSLISTSKRQQTLKALLQIGVSPCKCNHAGKVARDLLLNSNVQQQLMLATAEVKEYQKVSAEIEVRAAMAASTQTSPPLLINSSSFAEWERSPETPVHDIPSHTDVANEVRENESLRSSLIPHHQVEVPRTFLSSSSPSLNNTEETTMMTLSERSSSSPSNASSNETGIAIEKLLGKDFCTRLVQYKLKVAEHYAIRENELRQVIKSQQDELVKVRELSRGYEQLADACRHQLDACRAECEAAKRLCNVLKGQNGHHHHHHREN